MCQCTKSHSQERYHNQVMGINISFKFLMPEAISCCLQTCKCGFEYCVPVYIPSLIVRNANTTKL